MAEDFSRTAAQTLKAELVRAGVSYKELSERLAIQGEFQSPRAIASKISRGTFSFAFFLHCMKALGRDTIRLDP